VQEKSTLATRRGRPVPTRDGRFKERSPAVDPLFTAGDSVLRRGKQPMTSIRGQNSPGAHQIARLAARSERQMQRLASGKRIATAADDPAGLAIATRLAASVRSAAAGERNLADGQSLVRTAEGALQTSHDTLGRMRELAVAARNGTLAPDDRAVIQQEFDQLAEQLDQTAGGVTFGERPLLDGSASGAGAIVSSDGAGGDHVIDIGDARSAALGVAGRDVAAADTIAAVDSAGARVAIMRAMLGAADSSQERHAGQLAVAAEAASAAQSRLEDADLANEISARVRDRILMQLAIAGQRQGSGSPRRLLDLLG
jgi:flagellin